MSRRIGRVRRSLLIILATVAALAVAGPWVTGQMSSFDLSRHTVPVDQIMSGGPPKDGIPALLAPKFVPGSEASFLEDDDRVLGVSRGGEAKAYPIKILNWHEVVNDSVGGRPLVVTYCPLCGTGIAFDAEVQGRVHTFGVSGLLYQSDLLMYDHRTESLWSQVSMEAVAGPLTGVKLAPVYLVHTTWDDWRGEHPKTVVLSTETGYNREYSRDPYHGYDQSRDLMFDVTHFDPTYHPKDWVVGVEVEGTYKAYAFAELDRSPELLTDRVNGRTLRIRFNPKARSARITDQAGKAVPSVTAFWFAWYAFHPDTEIFTAPK